MNYSEFLEKMRDHLSRSLDGVEITIREVLKNNNTRLKGLTLKNGEHLASPTIYMEPFYEMFQKGDTIDSLGEQIIDLYRDSISKAGFDESILHDYSSARKHLYLKALNLKRNEELLSHVPYRKYLDLGLVPYVQLNGFADGCATAVVNSQMIDFWGCTAEEVLADASDNMLKEEDYRLVPILDLIREMISEKMQANGDGPEEAPKMYVLMNARKSFSAALMCMESVMEHLADQLQSDLIVLPSSIHEVIIVPADKDMDLKKLNELVQSVNDTTVSSEEVLADHAYYYKRGEGYQEQ